MISLKTIYLNIGNLVKQAEDLGCDLRDLPLNSFREIASVSNDKVLEVLTIDNSVKSKNSYGGTAPGQVKLRILEWRKKLM